MWTEVVDTGRTQSLLFTNFGGTRSNVTSNSESPIATIKSTTLLKATLKNLRLAATNRGEDFRFASDRLIMAILTSRRMKRANVQHFQTWRRLLTQIQLYEAEADFSNRFSFKWYYVWISRSKYHCSFLRGKWILIITEKSCIKCI